MWEPKSYENEEFCVTCQTSDMFSRLLERCYAPGDSERTELMRKVEAFYENLHETETNAPVLGDFDYGDDSQWLTGQSDYEFLSDDDESFDEYD